MRHGLRCLRHAEDDMSSDDQDQDEHGNQLSPRILRIHCVRPTVGQNSSSTFQKLDPGPEVCSIINPTSVSTPHASRPLNRYNASSYSIIRIREPLSPFPPPSSTGPSHYLPPAPCSSLNKVPQITRVISIKISLRTCAPVLVARQAVV